MGLKAISQNCVLAGSDIEILGTMKRNVEVKQIQSRETLAESLETYSNVWNFWGSKSHRSSANSTSGIRSTTSSSVLVVVIGVVVVVVGGSRGS